MFGAVAAAAALEERLALLPLSSDARVAAAAIACASAYDEMDA